jgi:UDP-N-acetylmuramoylalanine--D-glutamate ligase
MIARACLLSLGVTEAGDEDALLHAAADFAGLDSRLRAIGSIAGVTFVDDSLSKNVLPTVAALDAYQHERVALIVGGHDRGIDYGPLGEALAVRAARLGAGEVAVFSIPENGTRISAMIREHLGDPAAVTDCGDLHEAVKAGYAWAARASGIVLLSPAAPSFGLFHDYKDRALAFAAAMAECGR